VTEGGSLYRVGRICEKVGFKPKMTEWGSYGWWERRINIARWCERGVGRGESEIQGRRIGQTNNDDAPAVSSVKYSVERLERVWPRPLSRDCCPPTAQVLCSLSYGRSTLDRGNERADEWRQPILCSRHPLHTILHTPPLIDGATGLPSRNSKWMMTEDRQISRQVASLCSYWSSFFHRKDETRSK